MLRRRVPDYADEYARRGWTMSPALDRVYVNERARAELGWQPRHDFARSDRPPAAGDDWRSPLAQAIGAKGYHAEAFADGPFPVDQH